MNPCFCCQLKRVIYHSSFPPGSLIKLIYFSRHEGHPVDDRRKRTIKQRLGVSNGNRRSYPILGGRLHFVKFETRKINECLEFISSKQLHCGGKVISHVSSVFDVAMCSTLFIFTSFKGLSLHFFIFFLIPLLDLTGLYASHWNSEVSNENAVIKVLIEK